MQSDIRKSSDESSSSESDSIFENFFIDQKHGEKSEPKDSHTSSANLEKSQKSSRESSSSTEAADEDEIIYVPDNPKKWTEDDISKWIKWATKKFKLGSSIDSAKFPRTAEELSIFTKAEFYIACGSFDGGKKVSKHYKYLMDIVKEPCHESLLDDGEPGQ